MKIIKPADLGADLATEAGITSLVATMFCLENAAAVVADDLTPLPAPHQPWPLVTIPPVTEKGVAAAVHYKPSLGIVFHELGDGDAKKFADRVAAALDEMGDDHLMGHRAAMATPGVVVRHTGRVVSGSVKAEVSELFWRAAPEQGAVGKNSVISADVRTGIPSRMYLTVRSAANPTSELYFAPHFSARAAFTWVFMPVAWALNYRSFNHPAEVNAMVASAFYDSAGLCKHPHGAEIYRLRLSDFNHSSLDTVTQLFSFEPVTCGTTIYRRNFNGSRIEKPSECVLVVKKADKGSLELVGHYLGLRKMTVSPGRQHARTSLPEWRWNAAQIVAPEMRRERSASAKPAGYQCCSCCVPVGGPAIVFAGVTIPSVDVGPSHRTDHRCGVPGHAGEVVLPARPKEGDGPASRRFLLCLRCWNRLDSPACLTDHLGAKVWRTTVPLTQAQACARSPGFEGLTRLLEGTATAVPDVSGAFIVTAADMRFIIAGAQLGSYPELTVPALAAYKLPVVSRLRIAA